MQASEYVLTTSVTDPEGNMHIILVDKTERAFVPIFVNQKFVSFLKRSMETEEEIDLASFWQFQVQSWAMMGFESLSLIIDHTAENGVSCFASFKTRQEVPMSVVTSFLIPIPVAFILSFHFDFKLYLTDRAQTCLAALAMSELDEYLRNVSAGEGTYGGIL